MPPLKSSQAIRYVAVAAAGSKRDARRICGAPKADHQNPVSPHCHPPINLTLSVIIQGYFTSSTGTSARFHTLLATDPINILPITPRPWVPMMI